MWGKLKSTLTVSKCFFCMFLITTGLFCPKKSGMGGKRVLGFKISFMTHGSITKINRRGGDLFRKFVFCFFFSDSHIWAVEGVAAEGMYIRSKLGEQKAVFQCLLLAVCMYFSLFLSPCSFCSAAQITLEPNTKNNCIYICQDTL